MGLDEFIGNLKTVISKDNKIFDIIWTDKSKPKKINIKVLKKIKKIKKINIKSKKQMFNRKTYVKNFKKLKNRR